MPISTNTLGGSEGYKAGPRAKASDQLPRAAAPISLTWASLEKKDDFRYWIRDRIREGIDARKDMDEAVRANRRRYDGDTPEGHKEEGFANIHVPVTRSLIDTFDANIYKTLFGVAPIFQVTTKDPEAAEAVPAIQSAMQSIVVDDLQLPMLGRHAIHRSSIDRTAVFALTWETRIEKKRSWEEVTQQFIDELAGASEVTKKANREVSEQWKQYTDHAAKLLNDYEQSMKVYIQAITARPDLQEVIPAPVPPAPPDPLYAIVFREELTRDAPSLRRIDILDYGTYPTDIAAQEQASMQFARDWFTKGRLNAEVLSGRFDGVAVAELTENATASEGRSSESAGGDRDAREAQGIRMDTELTQAEKPYEIFTVLVKWDCDDDGQDELCLIEIDMQTAIILRAELYPYWHDRPFFILINNIENPGSLYGYSVPEILEHYQAEINTMHNQRTDSATLTINAPLVAPMGLKKKLEGRYIRPREVYFTESPKDAIQRVDLSSNTAPTAELEREANAMAQDVMGINATVQGQTTGGGTTSNEIERALQSLNIKFDYRFDALREQFSEIPRQILGLYRQYYPGDYQYTSVDQAGRTIFQTLTRAQIRQGVNFVVHGTSALANPNIQYQMAEKLALWGERSPFVQADLARRYYLDRHFLVEGMNIPDTQAVKMIGTPDEAKQKQAELAQAPPPPPEIKVSESRRIDEVQTLAIALKEGTITAEEYMAAAVLAKQANVVMGIVVPGTEEAAATDSPAGQASPTATKKPVKKTSTSK